MRDYNFTDKVASKLVLIDNKRLQSTINVYLPTIFCILIKLCARIFNHLKKL